LASSVPTTTEPAWLAARREAARGRAAGLELPSFKGQPGWEFTPLTGLDLDAFTAAEGGDPGAIERAQPLFAIDGAIATGQVDGTIVGEPAARGADDAPVVLPLALAAERHPELVERHLGTVVPSDVDRFSAVNEGEWTGGLFVYVPRNARLEAPVLHTLVQEAGGSALATRTLIVLEEGAQAEVWEQHLSASDDVDAVLNTVVELKVGPGANLRYVAGQHLSESSAVFGTHRAEVERDGRLDWVALGFGSARGKVRMDTRLAGEGADAKVTGAYAGHGRQHLDYDTTQVHAAAHTTSDLAFRGILQDRSTAVWRGMIRVDEGAQQTDAFQESRNLLLSKRAHADAIPGLEIEANDVRCTHAAAIAQIDKEQLFYLRSRGLRDAAARRLVIEGFLQELVARFEEGSVRETLAGALERRLHEILD
jgi:Fe-S cluster assembly protein SufD